MSLMYLSQRKLKLSRDTHKLLKGLEEFCAKFTRGSQVPEYYSLEVVQTISAQKARARAVLAIV